MLRELLSAALIRYVVFWKRLLSSRRGSVSNTGHHGSRGQRTTHRSFASHFRSVSGKVV